MKVNFTKMNGCGNDFVIIDNRDKSVNLKHYDKIKLADRNNSITKGCDQLIVLEPSFTANVFMRIYNPDGSEAQACGNATRCVAKLLSEEPIYSRKIRIQTIERILLCYIGKNGVTVNMGEALSYEEVDLGDEYAELGEAVSVNVGNPHCIFFVDDAKKIDLEKWGPKIENHSLFPERTNVEFVSEIKDDDFRLRVWERGVGITKACGSGAAAVAWAIYKSDYEYYPSFIIRMDGGFVSVEIEDDESIAMIGDTELEFKDSVEV